MSRKSSKSQQDRVSKKYLRHDPVFGDLRLSKFINILMYDGKKSVAEHIVYECLELIKQKMKKEAEMKGNALTVFNQAIDNVRPLLEVKSRRVGGATYQVPVEVREDRQESLAMRWIITAARDRKEHSMQEKLVAELFEAFNRRGGAMKKREDVVRMAEANKAFAHYRW